MRGLEDMAQQLGTDAYARKTIEVSRTCSQCDYAQDFVAADGTTALLALGKPWKSSLVAQKMASSLVEKCAYCLIKLCIVRKDESADACDDWEGEEC